MSIVANILNYLVDHVEDLSRTKGSGVYSTGLGYRVHFNHALPQFLHSVSSKHVLDTVTSTKFKRPVHFDALTLWFTIV